MTTAVASPVRISSSAARPKAAASSTEVSDAIDAILGTRPLYLVADLFAGAGGTSSGARRAIRAMGGELELTCVNHWQAAVDVHKLNHPDAVHIVEDVDTVRPRKVVPNGKLHLLMASPPCQSHSMARGGKPIEGQGRMGAWSINNWLTQLYVERLLVENVPQFKFWGPICGLLDGHKGEHLECMGVDPDPICGEEADGPAFNLLRRMHAPRVARKFVKQARKYGCPLEPLHEGDCQFDRELPPQPCRRPVDGKKGMFFQAWYASLIALGYDVDFRVLNSADFGDATDRKRFFLQARRDGKPIRWPEPTHAPAHIAAKPRLDGKKLLPYVPAKAIIDWSDEGQSIFDRETPLSENTRYRMARGLQRYGGPLAPLYVDLLDLPADGLAKKLKAKDWSFEQQPFLFANRAHNVPTSTDQPTATITSASGGGSYMVVPDAQPYLIGQHTGNAAQGVEEPTPTVTSISRIRLFNPTADRIVVPQHAGGIARTSEVPLPTITGNGTGVAQPTVEPADAFITANWGERPTQTPRVHGIEGLLPAVTSRGAGNLIRPVIIQTDQTGCNGTVRDTEATLPTLVTKQNLGLIQTQALEFTKVKLPSGVTVDPRRLVIIDGELCVLDIKYRMLKNPELAKAMGFDDDEARYEFVGTQTDITRMIGNAVSVGVATALVSAMLYDASPELARKVA